MYLRGSGHALPAPLRRVRANPQAPRHPLSYSHFGAYFWRWTHLVRLAGAQANHHWPRGPAAPGPILTSIITQLSSPFGPPLQPASNQSIHIYYGALPPSLNRDGSHDRHGRLHTACDFSPVPLTLERCGNSSCTPNTREGWKTLPSLH